MTRTESITKQFVLASKRAGDWVIIESKNSKRARKTDFGFQAKRNQDLSGEWYPVEHGAYLRAVGVLENNNIRYI